MQGKYHPLTLCSIDELTCWIYGSRLDIPGLLNSIMWSVLIPTCQSHSYQTILFRSNWSNNQVWLYSCSGRKPNKTIHRSPNDTIFIICYYSWFTSSIAYITCKYIKVVNVTVLSSTALSQTYLTCRGRLIKNAWVKTVHLIQWDPSIN